MKLIDLTHTFTTSGMPIWPGDPEPTIKQVASVEKDTFTDHLLTTIMHTGTHMDGPLHMIAGGKKLHEFPVDHFFGPGVLVDARGKKNIDADILGNNYIAKDSVVLIFTDFAKKYKTPDYFKEYPAVTEEFAEKMVEMGVKMVGMDILGPDHDKPWPAHKVLLGNNILILENLTNLDQLVGEQFEVIALPAKLESDSAPVRVVAKIT